MNFKTYRIDYNKMSGRGKGGKGLGKGGAKKHRNVSQDNIQGITKPAICRLARRGGVKSQFNLCCITEGVNGKNNKKINKVFTNNGLKNSANGNAAKSTWDKTMKLHGGEAYLNQIVFSNSKIIDSYVMDLPVPKDTPHRSVLFTKNKINGHEILGATTQLPGGRFDDGKGVQEQNCRMKIMAFHQILEQNPDFIACDANTVLGPGNDSNIRSYTKSLIFGCITRSKTYYSNLWMFMNQKDKITGKSLLDTFDEKGYGILYLKESSTSMYISGDAIGPDFILYKKSVFTPVGEVTSCEMYNGSNDQKRLSDHKSLAVTLMHIQSGEEIQIVNANVECWFGVASPCGMEIDNGKLEMLAYKLTKM